MSWPYVTGQQRGSRPYIGETDGNDFSLGDYVDMRLEVNIGLGLYTHDRAVIISDANEYRGVLLHRTAKRCANFSPEGRQSPINLPNAV